MNTILTPTEQAALTADFDKKSSDIRNQSLLYLSSAATYAATTTAYVKTKWRATYDMTAGIVQLVLDFGDPANFEVIDKVFESYGLIGPRVGDNHVASFTTLATGYQGVNMVQSPRAGQGVVPEWIKNRSTEKLTAPASEVVARILGGEVINDVAAYIENYVDEVTGRKGLIGLADAWKRRSKGDEPEVTVSVEEVAASIINKMATTETLATVDVSDLPAGVVMDRVTEVLAIIGDDGKVRFQHSPRQDLAALSAGLTMPDGSNAKLPIKQTMELFASSALLLPTGWSGLPKNEGDAPSVPGTELLPTTRQHALIDGVWSSSLAREDSPRLIMMAKPIGPGLTLPAGSSFVNAAQRGRVEEHIMPPEKRELYDDVVLGTSTAGVTSLRGAGREPRQGLKPQPAAHVGVRPRPSRNVDVAAGRQGVQADRFLRSAGGCAGRPGHELCDQEHSQGHR